MNIDSRYLLIPAGLAAVVAAILIIGIDRDNAEMINLLRFTFPLQFAILATALLYPFSILFGIRIKMRHIILITLGFILLFIMFSHLFSITYNNLLEIILEFLAPFISR